MVTDEPKTTSGGVTCSGLCKHFPMPDGTPASVLDDIDLDIAPGEIIAIIGPSGCGKTTLLRLITGLETPTAGTLLLDGNRNGAVACERTLMSQQANLFPWLTVRRNVAFGLEARRKREGLSGTAIDKKVARLLRMVELEGFEDAWSHQLSGGMAQRAALARAVAIEPAVLLLDEPFGSLDAFTKIGLQEELLALWREKPRTIILVTHDIDEAVFLADRVAIMSPRPGRISRVVPVPLPHPRDRMEPDFLRLRELIYREFQARVERPFSYQI